jgi:hypothetical protein
MSRFVPSFEMFVGFAERNEALTKAKKELAQTRQFDESWSNCNCGGGEYDVCPHPKQERRNASWETLNDRIKELQKMTFCGECYYQRLSNSWVRCPFCRTSVDLWVGGQHDKPECRASPAHLKYCGGCGQLN